jgi:dTDP-4-dehydrorhamnose 3,5-epimerase-like enzyme
MIKLNIYRPEEGTNLEVHSDNRGTIADVFYGTSINHVCVLRSNPDAVRGNHYHNHTVQHTLLTKGKMRYWWQKADKSEPAQFIDAEIGDLITSNAGEIHTLEFLDEESECMVFTEGPRGGVDYEKDTVRVDNIITGGGE